MALKTFEFIDGKIYKDISKNKIFKSQDDFEELTKATDNEDFALHKKPIRHIRMRAGKPYYAGTGAAKPR